VGPVTDALRAQLQDVPFDDGERVEGLGDEAYATKFRSAAEGAVRASLPRLAQLAPASTWPS
jgi:hypothetical protein